jgi:hypothetical protein
MMKINLITPANRIARIIPRESKPISNNRPSLWKKSCNISVIAAITRLATKAYFNEILLNIRTVRIKKETLWPIFLVIKASLNSEGKGEKNSLNEGEEFH